MEKITLHIKDKSKLNLLLERLKQFDFVEISLPQGLASDPAAVEFMIIPRPYACQN